MRKPFVFVGLLAMTFSGGGVFAQGPCSVQSSKLACDPARIWICCRARRPEYTQFQ